MNSLQQSTVTITFTVSALKQHFVEVWNSTKLIQQFGKKHKSSCHVWKQYKMEKSETNDEVEKWSKNQSAILLIRGIRHLQSSYFNIFVWFLVQTT